MKKLILLLSTAMLFACASQQKVVTVTEYRDRVQHDTVVRVDSVYQSHTQYLKGDTLVLHDTLRTFAWRDKTRDVYVHDSIPYEVQIPVPVRQRNGYDRFTSWGFWVLLVLLILRVAWWAFKKFYLHQ